MRVGIVGAGQVAVRHAAAYDAHPDAAVVAVAEPLRERGEALAAAHGARWFASLDDLLAASGVDAISICVPHHLHRPTRSSRPATRACTCSSRSRSRTRSTTRTRSSRRPARPGRAHDRLRPSLPQRGARREAALRAARSASRSRSSTASARWAARIRRRGCGIARRPAAVCSCTAGSTRSTGCGGCSIARCVVRPARTRRTASATSRTVWSRCSVSAEARPRRCRAAHRRSAGPAAGRRSSSAPRAPCGSRPASGSR